MRALMVGTVLLLALYPSDEPLSAIASPERPPNEPARVIICA